MQSTSRIAAAAFIAAFALITGVANGGGEYQGFEPLPAVVEIRFNREAVGFRVAENDYVPGGPRYFALPRGARDWQRIDAAAFNTRFPDRTLPGAVTLGEPGERFIILSTSDGAHFISTDFQCMEGSYHWAGLRHNGDWMRTWASDCVNIGAMESTGEWLLLGTSYVGEAGMFYGGEGIVALNRTTGEREKRIGFSGRLYAGGMIRHMRRDPFTGDVWAATLTGLWRITENIELVEKLFFADIFDTKANATRTHLTEKPASDPYAQYVRAMNIRDPGAVYAYLDARRAQIKPSFFMYQFGMGMANWIGADTQPLLPHFIEAFAYGHNGSWNTRFVRALEQFDHPCMQDAGNLWPETSAGESARRALLNCFTAAGMEIPPHEPAVVVNAPQAKPPLVPASSTFSAPPREAFLRQADGQAAWSKVHAAWFAWQGGINSSGEYVFTRRCVDFDTVEVGNDGYYRFDSRTFRRDGDWVGAENRYAIESDEYQEQSFYNEAPSYFGLPPSHAVPSGGRPSTPAERLALECQADGVQSERITQLLARVEKQKAAEAERVAAARAEVRRKADATEQRRMQNMILTPEVSVEAVTYESGDPRLLEFYRKHGLEPPKPPEKNSLIEGMQKEKAEAKKLREAQEENE